MVELEAEITEEAGRRWMRCLVRLCDPWREGRKL
jgi:hypothetical protein